MTADKLLEAIGDIDDTFVEEFAFGRFKGTRRYWGLAASAACLCLVIAAAVFLRNAGLLPAAPMPTDGPGPVATVTNPTDTGSTETTVHSETTQPTNPLETKPVETAPSAQLQAFNDLFGDYRSWYNRALICEYDNPKQLKLLQLFYSGFEGESQKPTEEEWAMLKDKEGFNENFDLLRLPVSKMNEILTEYFGITLDSIPADGFEGLTYLESTDCWYFMTTSTRFADFTAQAVETLADGNIRVFYDGGYKGSMVVILQPNGDGYRILSNVKLLEDINDLFGEAGSWYNLALTSVYDSPKELGLRYFFLNGLEGESRKPTAEEYELLKKDPIVKLDEELIRLPVAKMNEILTRYFGITVEEVNEESAAFAGITYLERTDCWYISSIGALSVPNFTAWSAMVSPDGILQVYYSTGTETQATHVMILQPNGDDYRILSNKIIK